MRKVIFIILLMIFIGCQKSNNNQNIKETRIDTIFFPKSKIKELHFWNKGKLDSIRKYRKDKYIGYGKVKDDYIIFYLKEKNIKQYEGFLKNGKLDGIVYHYNLNGEISGVFNYKNGIKNGIAMILNDSLKKPKIIGNYVDGDMKNGFVIKFNENGTPNYLLENGNNINAHFQTIEFYNNGTIKEINSKNSSLTLDGWSIEFNENGMIKNKILYSNGENIKEENIRK